MNSYRWEQVDWFANSLIADKPERSVALLHMVLEGNPTGVYERPFVDNLTKVAQAFNNKETITLNNKTYNFTQSTGHFYFVLGGHTHADANLEQNGIPVVATTRLCVGANVTLDLVLIDYNTNKLHLIRVGSGNDREITMA
jgi:hypothetical protein